MIRRKLAVFALVYTATSAILCFRPAIAGVIPNTSANLDLQRFINSQASTLEVRLRGTDLYNSLVRDVSRDVEKKIEAQNQEILRMSGLGISIILALAAFAGFRSFADFRARVTGDIKEDLRSSDLIKRIVEESIQANITSDIDKRLSVVSKELSFYRLSNLASALRSGTGFSNTERDAALDSLRQLSNEMKITSRKEFADVLEKIIDAFNAADLDFYIDTIEEMLSGVIEETPGIVMTLIHHYGMRVLGDIEEDADTLRRFHKYSEVCRKLRLYERALPYKMVLEYRNKKEGWENRIDSLIQDAECLPDDDKDTFRRLLKTNTDINEVCRTPTGKTLRFTHSFKDFLDAYAVSLGLSPMSSPA
jgi:hypothetical protein